MSICRMFWTNLTIVLNRYMYLSGRFDMREVERTVQRLIRDGSRLDHKHLNIVFFKILILLEVHITQFG
jgi:hypothetical protein